MIQRRKPIRRSPVRKVNPKRKASEFARCYGSKARVAFVKALPCAACGRQGQSENAHAFGDGAGRKGPYTAILPLCGDCHRKQHSRGWSALAWLRSPEIRIGWANVTEAGWQEHLSLQAYLNRGTEP